MSGSRADAERAILASRARELARPLEPPRRGEELAVVEFSVGDERFYVEAPYVLEVMRLRHLGRVPGTPIAVRGVTTYRGEILATLEVRALLGRPGAGLAHIPWVIVLGQATAELGLLADVVRGVTSVSVAELRPLPADPATPTRRFARALTSDAAILLDGAALLAETLIWSAGWADA